MAKYVFGEVRQLALIFLTIWANSIIMRTEKYHLNALQRFLGKEKIATLSQLAQVLGNPTRCTVFRKLGQLQYLSSFSHRGKYRYRTDEQRRQTGWIGAQKSPNF